MTEFLKTAARVAVIMLFAAGPAGAGPYEEGLAAYQHQDYMAALEIWQPLAEQGNGQAQHHLGLMYAHGTGVPHDNAAAHMWFTLAAKHGFETARSARDVLVRQMTHGQIEEATLMTREWMAEHRR